MHNYLTPYFYNRSRLIICTHISEKNQKMYSLHNTWVKDSRHAPAAPTGGCSTVKLSFLNVFRWLWLRSEFGPLILVFVVNAWIRNMLIAFSIWVDYWTSANCMFHMKYSVQPELFSKFHTCVQWSTGNEHRVQ